MEKFGRKVKNLMVDQVVELIKKNPYIFFVGFQKIPSSKTGKLRRMLKKSSCELRVVKKSILKLALKKRKLDTLFDLAEGSSAITVAKENPARTSKILFDFSRADENMVIKGGYVDGEILFVDRIKELAMLPSREVLLARVIGGIKSPISGIVNVLQGNIQKLACVLNAISSAKGGKREEGG